MNLNNVLYWDPVTGWEIMHSGDNLEPGIGYVVNSDTEHSIDLSGTPQSSPFTEDVVEGWQIIGNPFTTSCTLSSTVAIQNVLYWDPTTGWEILHPDSNGYYTLQPGTGYVINASSSGTLTFTATP